MSDDGEDNTTSPEQRASGRARPSLAGKAGRSAACGYHAPGRSAGKAARLMVMSCGGGEGGRPTCQLPATRGLVEEPVAAHAAGNAVADRRSLPAGLGKTQRPVDRGAGGNRCQSALPCGTRRLPPTRPRPGAPSDPGKASLNTILEEIDKLERVRAIGLPTDLFADCSEKLLGAWRARAAAAYPSDLRAMPAPIRLTLLAVLCWSRTADITDALVDLLIDVVDKIRVRAEKRVEKALVADLKRVSGKQGYCSHSPAPRSIIPTRPSAPRS